MQDPNLWADKAGQAVTLEEMAKVTRRSNLRFY